MSIKKLSSKKFGYNQLSRKIKAKRRAEKRQSVGDGKGQINLVGERTNKNT